MIRYDKPTLHLICGLPGSGKSTLAAELESRLGVIRFNPDAWLMRIVGNGHDAEARAAVETLQWELAQKFLAHGVSVVLEFGFWKREERESYARVAHELGAITELHFLNAPLSELKARIEKRNAQSLPDTVHVDPEMIESWAQNFEAPTDDELDRWAPDGQF